MKLSIQDIKNQLKGNFEEIIKSLDKKSTMIIERCESEKTYNSSISKMLEFVFNITNALETAILKNDTWNIHEARISLLYLHIIAIELNSTAHKFLNNITPEPTAKQLADWVNEKRTAKPSLFDTNLIIIS